MLSRRRLTWLWGLEGPPLASVTLMLLLGVVWLLGGCENLSLAPALLFRNFQVYRLATYCLCHTDPSLLLLNLLLFPVLGWRQERQQGTLRYLHASLLSAVISALLYLILAGLWAPAPDAASGYTPVHLAMLGRHLVLRSRAGASGQVGAGALPWLLLAFSQLLSPGCPFLLHLSGALTGLAYWSRSCRGWSYRRGAWKCYMMGLSAGHWREVASSALSCVQERGSFPLAMRPAPGAGLQDSLPPQPSSASQGAFQTSPWPWHLPLLGLLKDRGAGRALGCHTCLSLWLTSQISMGVLPPGTAPACTLGHHSWVWERSCWMSSCCWPGSRPP
uniref:Rhomboid domain containing 3 n=1 Tax=Gopherus evgoodei TaxID=1825980 RepID=A0A8C4YEY6_9SAUR